MFDCMYTGRTNLRLGLNPKKCLSFPFKIKGLIHENVMQNRCNPYKPESDSPKKVNKQYLSRRIDLWKKQGLERKDKRFEMKIGTRFFWGLEVE